MVHEYKPNPWVAAEQCVLNPCAGSGGAAARTRQTQLVPDVEAFPGHIACSSSTRSEIVVPVIGAGGRLIGVLDIDSDRPDAFTPADQAALERMMQDVFGGI